MKQNKVFTFGGRFRQKDRMDQFQASVHETIPTPSLFNKVIPAVAETSGRWT
jgi:hypothetical protein